MATPPTGTVTFLFTDIEGSTALWEKYPEAMKPALARHDAILRSTVESNDGYVVKMRGDGIHAAFASAPDALTAILAAQRELCAEAWGEIGRLRVRYALHTGAVEERDGDYFGSPVNRAARLLSCGYGDQILLSFATQELVREHLPDGVGLRDMGEHRLKDLIRPEQVFQALAPDLPSEFPPLKSLDARPNNLPAQTTPLVGRDTEIAAVTSLLLRPEVRLLTLTGPGGTGKTRLGLQIAADSLDHFKDGAFFIDLAPARDPGLVISAIAQTLGVRESGGQSLLHALKEYLHDKQMLWLLDNFEQVVSAAPLVAELLEASPALKILVTSREVLRLRGEHEFAVPPLALPDLKRLPAGAELVSALTQFPAVALFVQRAVAVKLNFVVNEQNATAIAEICVRLDGLPLAIELAAARCKLLSPQAIRSRLESSLSLLTGGARDLPERHQTLHGTIAWSYELLDGIDKTLFRRLSVFVGGCSLDAAEQICNPGNELEIDMLDQLGALVDKSLVRQQESPDGESRFVMLETIREYARGIFEESGEAPAIRQQHAQFFLGLVVEAEPQLTGADQCAWLQRIDQEHDNLRAVLRWASQNETEMGLRVVASLWRFWYMRGYLSEGRGWLEKFIASPAPSGSPDPATRAKALNALGVLAQHQGDYTPAIAAYEQALALRRELGDQRGVASVLSNLGFTVGQQGDHARAAALLEEGLAIARQVGDKLGLSIALNNLGELERRQNNYARAAALLEESLALRRELKNQRGIAIGLNNLGEIAQIEGNPERAMTLLGESLGIFRELGDKWGAAGALVILGDIATSQGELKRAVELYSESLTFRRELGEKEGIAFCLEGFAGVACAQDQPERAARLLGAAEQVRQAICAPLQPGNWAGVDHCCAAVRARLSEEKFAAAWANGRAMTLEQATAFALEPSSMNSGE